MPKAATDKGLERCGRLAIPPYRRSNEHLAATHLKTEIESAEVGGLLMELSQGR